MSQGSTFTTQPRRVNEVKALATDYVAVIAIMPPAAPAKEWIEESLGIVEGWVWDEGDGKYSPVASCHPSSPRM